MITNHDIICLLNSFPLFTNVNITGGPRKNSPPSVLHVSLWYSLCLALVCTLRRVFEQSVNSRAVTMLGYTRFNMMNLMAAAASPMFVLQFLYRVRIWFVCRTFQVSSEKISLPPPRNFLLGHLKSTVYESNPHTIQELKDNISHAVAAIKITMLHRVYLNMIRHAQLCIDAADNHFQHLLWWNILSAFGYCINFCIYAMLWTRATFSWHILYKDVIYIFFSNVMDQLWNKRKLLRQKQRRIILIAPYM